MTNENFAVRPLRETDLDEWFRLRTMLWDELSSAEHQSEMVDIFEHTDSQLILAADLGGGRLCGFLEASIRPFVEDCQTDQVGYLEGWFVEAEFRRQGIGGKLVQNAEQWARRKGVTEMASDAEIGNETSLKAHQNLGYSETSRLIHLRKELD